MGNTLFSERYQASCGFVYVRAQTSVTGQHVRVTVWSGSKSEQRFAPAESGDMQVELAFQMRDEMLADHFGIFVPGARYP